MKLRIFHKNFQILKSSDRKNKILFTNALFKLTKVECTKLLWVIDRLRGKRKDFLIYPEN